MYTFFFLTSECKNFIIFHFFPQELKIPLPKRSKEAIKNLEIWAKENGVDMHKSVIAEFPAYGYGLQTTEAIKQGDIVISVPRKLMMSVDCINGSPMGMSLNKNKYLAKHLTILLLLFFFCRKLV